MNDRRMVGPLCAIRHRVALAEVDAARVIFYATPYIWHASMLGEWFAQLGNPIGKLIDDGSSPPCVSSAAYYLLPVRLDDLVELTLYSKEVGRTSFSLSTDVSLQGRRAVFVESKHVWITPRRPGGREPAELPDWLRKALQSGLTT